MKINNYLNYLHEKDNKAVKIHPKRKEIDSIAGIANPLDDIVFGGAGATGAYKAVKKAGGSTAKALGAGGVGVAGGLVMGAAFVAGYRLIRSWFDKCTSTCGTYKVNTPKRQLCMLKCKKLAIEKHIALCEKHNKTKQIPALQSKLVVINKKITLYIKYLKQGKE